MTDQKDDLPVSHNARLLECDECGDIVVPSHNLTFKEMKETSCSQCNFGKLKSQRRDVTLRKDVKQMLEGLDRDIRAMIKEHDRDVPYFVYDLIQELLEEVQNQ